MIPAGKYRAIACSTPQLSETKNGKPFVAVDFKLLGGETGGEVMTWQGWLTTEKSEAGTMRALKAAGWKGDNIADVGELDQEVSVTVEHETDDKGTTRAKLAWVNAPLVPLDKAKAKAIADKLKAKAAAMPNVAAPTASDDPFA